MILPLAHQGHIQQWAGHWYGRTKTELVPWSASGTYTVYHDTDAHYFIPIVQHSAGEANPKYLYGVDNRNNTYLLLRQDGVSFLEYSGVGSCSAYANAPKTIDNAICYNALTDTAGNAYTSNVSVIPGNNALRLEWYYTAIYNTSLSARSGGKSIFSPPWSGGIPVYSSYQQMRMYYSAAFRASPSGDQSDMVIHTAIRADTNAIGSFDIYNASYSIWSASGMALNK